jgi:hypothetical protein
MIRLLLVLVILLVASMLLIKDNSGEKPEIIYEQHLNEAEGLEQKILDDAARRMDEVDSLAR